MLYAIFITANARLDIQDAIDWENRRKPQLANRFLEQLDKKILSIAISPYSCTVRYDDVRCGVTEVFKYIIHYIIQEEEQKIIILRVLHTSRRPVW